MLLESFGTHWSGLKLDPGLNVVCLGRSFFHLFGSNTRSGLHLGQWQCLLNNEKFSFEFIPFTINFCQDKSITEKRVNFQNYMVCSLADNRKRENPLEVFSNP